MKKFMVALTGLVTVATLGATMTVPTTGITANAATKTTKRVTSPSLTVSAIYSNVKTVTGTATPGSVITVKASQNAKENLGVATADSSGRYSVKLAKALTTNSNVYVYATNPTTKSYYYEIIRVQAAKATAATDQTNSAKTDTTQQSTATTTKTSSTKLVAPTMNVDTIHSNDQTVTGTATPGAVITVKASQNAKDNLGTATVDANGQYSVKLAKTLTTNSNVYVYATNPTTKTYYYEIIRIQAASATPKTDQTSSSKTSTTKTTTPTKSTTSSTTKTSSTKLVAPTMNVNAIHSNDQTVTGTATPGAVITVKASQNAKDNLGTATVDANGQYSVKLTKTLTTNSNVYVYATNPTTKTYYYEIIRIQAATTPAKQTGTKTSSTKTTTKTTTTKKANATKKATSTKQAATKRLNIQAPAGTWTSNTANNYSQVWSFSNQEGFNQTLYKNGQPVKKLVAYANYQVAATNMTNVWKLTYKPSGAKKSSTVYLRYTTTKQFTLVNAKNQVVTAKAGAAPVTSWSFTQN